MIEKGEILFVCRENIGRSQVAMSWYNFFARIAGQGFAFSAGVDVDKPGEMVGMRPEAKEVIEVMHEANLDISKNVRTQLEPDLIRQFGRTILVMSKSKSDPVPDWLKSYELWETEDLKGLDIARTRVICNEIKWNTYNLVFKTKTKSENATNIPRFDYKLFT